MTREQVERVLGTRIEEQAATQQAGYMRIIGAKTIHSYQRLSFITFASKCFNLLFMCFEIFCLLKINFQNFGYSTCDICDLLSFITINNLVWLVLFDLMHDAPLNSFVGHLQFLSD